MPGRWPGVAAPASAPVVRAGATRLARMARAESGAGDDPARRAATAG